VYYRHRADTERDDIIKWWNKEELLLRVIISISEAVGVDRHRCVTKERTRREGKISGSNFSTAFGGVVEECKLFSRKQFSCSFRGNGKITVMAT